MMSSRSQTFSGVTLQLSLTEMPASRSSSMARVTCVKPVGWPQSRAYVASDAP